MNSRKKTCTITVPADYYQQFDADFALDVPAEGFGGWKKADIEISTARTAIVSMHAWDTGTREAYPGFHRCIEYLARADDILRAVYPRVLSAARQVELTVLHVVGGGTYFRDYPGYRRAVELAGEGTPLPKITSDPVLEKLWKFKHNRCFPGAHNVEDMDRGYANITFPAEAEPMGDEGVAATSEQLFALCEDKGINHLIYIGFAINACLMLSPGGILEMSKRGIMCSTIRQAVTAVETKETARGELGKEIALSHVGLLYGFVFDLEDLLKSLSPIRMR